MDHAAPKGIKQATKDWQPGHSPLSFLILGLVAICFLKLVLHDPILQRRELRVREVALILFIYSKACYVHKQWGPGGRGDTGRLISAQPTEELSNSCCCPEIDWATHLCRGASGMSPWPSCGLREWLGVMTLSPFWH